MLVKDRALFCYGFDVDNNNKYVNFRNQNLGSILTGVLNVGNYTLTTFLAELKRAMEIADGVYTYSWTVDRSIDSGRSNRVHITSSGTHLELLFGSGPNSQNSTADLIGFDQTDYTGSTTYSSSTNAGTLLYPDFAMENYLDPESYITQDGSKNVSAAGVKETLVFAQQQFMQGQWRFITNFAGTTQLTEWQAFLKYATRQLKFEITPSVLEDYSRFFQVTLESTPADSNGMAFKLNQMLGQGLYRFYETGLMKFRVIPDLS